VFVAVFVPVFGTTSWNRLPLELPPTGENFLYVSFQGHAFGAPAGTASAALRAQAPGPPAGLIRRSVPPKAAEVAGGPVAAGRARSPLLSGGSPRRGGGPRIAAPHRPQTVPAVALVAGAARAGQPSSSRQPSCRRAKITVKCARCARVASAMALRATLDTDLPRQDPAPIRRTGILPRMPYHLYIKSCMPRNSEIVACI
jgi:hypothetical protein